MSHRLTILILLLCCSHIALSARPSGRTYSQENPLIYEDSWNLWPYSFINNDGKPDGFNIDVVTYILGKLGIPYEIHLLRGSEARNDLRSDMSDLTIGVKQDANATYGQFSKKPIVTFTHSMLSPHRDSLDKVRISDLEMFYFNVHEGSLAHHYLSRRGFEQQMNPVDDMENLVKQIGARDSGAVVWNTLSLKWLRRKFHLDNLTLTDVDIPGGAFHFMSNDEKLLHRLDSILEVMNQDGELKAMTTQWLYPERLEETKSNFWDNMAICTIAFFVFALLMQCLYYYRRSRSGNSLDDVIAEMGLVLSSVGMEVWTYDIVTRKFAWMNTKGEQGGPYSESQFASFYAKGEMKTIMNCIKKLISEKERTMTLQLHLISDKKLMQQKKVEVRVEALNNEYNHAYLIVGLQHEIPVTSSTSNQ